MAEAGAARRLRILEEKVGSLEALPARMDALGSQFMQFRSEARAEFSAIRGEVAELRSAVQALDQKIDQGLEETRRYMRVLYEDLVERIATIGAARPPRRPKKR